MASFESKGVKIFYEVSGEGAALIFTHGASWNHLQWREQVEYFKKDYQVIVWDVRGHGYSELPDGPVDSGDFSRDLIALMDHLSLERASLCGLSMGGHISLQTAIRYPDRVEKLILIGTPFTNKFNLYEKIAVPINRFSSRFISIKTSSKLQAKMLSKFNPSNYDYIMEAFSMLSHDNWVRVWDTVTRMESRDDLDKVLCPTLLLIGDHDNLTNYQQPYLQENIANAQLKTISNAHHGSNMDNPYEVNQYIADFIK